MNIGIIGFGYMGKWHYNVLKCMPTVKDIYIYDNNIISNEIQNKYEVNIHNNIEELMENNSISCVIIATPNDTHAFYIKMALNYGKHVICEKPVTVSYKELESLIDISAKKNLHFTVHQNRRWDPDFLTIQFALQNGFFGNLVSIESRVYAQRGIMYGWRAEKKHGGGLLLDWGVHLIDQILLLFQNYKVISIIADVKSVMTKTVNDYFNVKLKFNNGITSVIESGTFALQKLPCWFIYGDHGTLIIDDFDCEKVKITQLKKEALRNNLNITHFSGVSRLLQPISSEQTISIDIPQYIHQKENEFYNNFFEAINGKAVLYVELSQIARVMKIIDVAQISSNKNEVIKTNI